MATVPAWFDVAYYLESKAAKDVPAKASGDEVRAELEAAGYVGDEGIFQHYNDWGVKEGLSPSAALEGFNEDAYLAAKAAHDAEVSGEAPKTVEELKAELANANMSAIDHYLAYNESEGTNYMPGEGNVTPEDPSGEVSEVAAALEALKVAQEDLAAALEEAGVEDVTEAKNAVSNDDDGGAAAAVNTVLAGGTGGVLTADTSAEYDAAVIAEQKKALEDAVADAQEAVDKADVTKEVNSVVAAMDSLQAILDESVDVKAAWEGALTKFNEANLTEGAAAQAALVNTFTADLQNADAAVFDLPAYADDADNGIVKDSDVVIIELNEDNEYVLTEDAADYKGAEDLLAALQAYVDVIEDAGKAFDKATTAATKVDKALGATDDTVEGEDYAPVVVASGEPALELSADEDDIVAGLAEAKAALADFTEDADSFNAAKAEYLKLAALEQAVTDAEAKISDAPDAGLGLTLLGVGDAFTEGDDIYLLTKEDEGGSLVDFGYEGKDMIFVGASVVEFVAIDDISASVGDASALEVFYTQDGDDLILYVEQNAAAGNVSAPSTDDLITVTLAGVSEITFEGGFLIAGEASA